MTTKQKALICLFPPGHGGRERPFRSNTMRLGIVFPRMNEPTQFSADIVVPDTDSLRLGIIEEAECELINQVDTDAFVKPGMNFELFEGTRRIGVGTWK